MAVNELAHQKSVVEGVELVNVYAAARAERSRIVRGYFAKLFSGNKAAQAADNSDGLEPLGY